MGALDGKVAVVTGGGTGIGFAVAERFAHEGAQVVIVGRRQERLDDAVRRIGHGARGVAADVGDDVQVERLFGGLDRVDILATCAGTAIFGPVDQVAPQAWRDLFQGRFFGQLSCCHFAVPKMPTGGVILLCSGVAGVAGLANYSGGSGLCGAVNAMGRALAVELAPRGIRVNVLSPGLISGTAAESNLAPEDRMNFLTQTLERIPMHRPGAAPDMAAAAFFLATCDYANGMVLNVDGGWTAS
jgi:NAD(P)-dependent dehydrogenase (short-subunit alcohol dehydrogenase family)